MPEKITGHFTCDNSYSIWVGNANQVSQKLLEATNTIASQIWQGEDLPPIDPQPECHLYICAWSDDSVHQGLIGSFTGAVTIHSGDSRWRVLPTKNNKGDSQFPTISEINSAIASAQTGDWKVPFVGAKNGGQPWAVAIQGVSSDAQWMWYDSGKDTQPKYPTSPYVPFAGFNHDEFLIFRIPCTEFGEPPKEEPVEKCCVMVCQCCHEKQDRPDPIIIKEKSCCCGTCVFEVRLQRLRYLSGKAGGLFEGWAELSFTSHVDGNMCNFPTGNGSYIKLGKRRGEYWKGWMPINNRAGILEVPCKGERSFDLMIEMIENPMNEKGLPAILEGGRPWGVSDPSTLTLRCGEKQSPILQKVRLELGGNRTEDMEVEVEFRFSQVTACSCCNCSEEEKTDSK
jgi:hypothetical protein